MANSDWRDETDVLKFSSEEIKRRQKKIRELMELRGIDCLIITGHSGTHGAEMANICYVAGLSGFFQGPQDGTGVRILFSAGIKTILATILPSGAIERRAKDMKIERVFQGIFPKTKILEEILREHDVKKEEICFVGDDLVDLGLMKSVGVPAAVANACEEIKREACYVTQRTGGRGAVREIAELILRTQGRWDELIEREYGK